jgi:hypothetical protein
MKHRNRPLGLLGAAILALAGGSAQAGTVTSTADTGPGTLRQAIADAVPGETIDFALPPPIFITLEAELVIDKSLLIQAPPAAPGSFSLFLSASGSTRHVRIAAGAAVAINGAFISGGFADRGGAILNDGRLNVANCRFDFNTAPGQPAGTGMGGSIHNTGTLAVSDCTFFDTVAIDFTDSFMAAGGAISNAGTVTANNCTFVQSRTPRGFGGVIANLAGGTATVSNCRLSFGSAQRGGAVYNAGVLTMNACTVSSTIHIGVGPTTFTGGAVFNAPGGTAALNGCTFSGNHASRGDSPQGGGGSVVNGGTLTASDCSFSGNTANGGAVGGAVFNAPLAAGVVPILTLNNCTLTGNESELHGGALANAGIAALNGCVLFNNSAAQDGGAIANVRLTEVRPVMTLDRCTVVGNGALSGGGIVNTGADLNLIRSTVNGNIAADGAGIYNQRFVIIEGPLPPQPSILFGGNSTLSDNRAFRGGAVLNEGQALLQNCTLANNRAEEGGGVRNDFGAVVKVGNTLLAHNGVGLNGFNEIGGFIESLGSNLDSDGSLGLAAAGDQSGTQAAPLDPKIGPLQNNGGPTQTHALLSGSPAIDAGDGTLAPGLTDQRGFGRIADGNGDGVAVIDIGAYELAFLSPKGIDRLGFLDYSTVEALDTHLPAGTTSFNLTIHYSAGIRPETFSAVLNGHDVTHLFNPGTGAGFETVAIPLQVGPNRLVLVAKGVRDGKPATDVDSLGFWVAEPPYGPR